METLSLETVKNFERLAPLWNGQSETSLLYQGFSGRKCSVLWGQAMPIKADLGGETSLESALEPSRWATGLLQTESRVSN